MKKSIAAVALLVHDYDEAIAFFTHVLRFTLREDTRRSATKRWVVVSPSETPRAEGGCALLLAQAADDEQRAGVGKQGAGRVFMFLHTDDFERDHAHMAQHGVRFTEAPRDEPYGRVVVFLDLYGNKWDLIQPTKNDDDA